MKNRVIKFRIWNGKSFLKGRELDDICLSVDGEPLIREGQELNLLEDNFIVQQYTGLKDKNGKEIYEGDIVKTNPEHPVCLLKMTRESEKFTDYSNGEVCWWNNGFAICQKNVGATRISEYSDCDCCPCGLEVIGNVFENSQLLS